MAQNKSKDLRKHERTTELNTFINCVAKLIAQQHTHPPASKKVKNENQGNSHPLSPGVIQTCVKWIHQNG